MTDRKIQIIKKENQEYPKYPDEFWAKLGKHETKWANHVSPNYLQKIKSELKVRDNDIFLVTYPRSGTTMTRRILLAMLDKKKGLETDAMLNEKNYDSVNSSTAFLEFEKDYVGFERAETIFEDKLGAPIRLLKTHLHAYNAPEGIFADQNVSTKQQKPKIIFVTRNPKDTCVSYFHMTKNDNGNGDMREVDFNTFLEMFLRTGPFLGHFACFCLFQVLRPF